MTEVHPRVATVQNLTKLYGQEFNLLELSDSEFHAQALREKTGCLPTIGCEVEVKWSSLFPEVAERFFGAPNKYGQFATSYHDLSPDLKTELDEICKEKDAVMIPRFQATKQAGIPKGNDAYWEFANSPAYSNRTLSAEVEILRDQGFIPRGYDHSLHITLGDISSKGGGVALILCGLELMYANPDRLEAATIPNRYGGATAWSRRGNDGLRDRHVNDLSLGSECASELRTLSVNDQSDISSIFLSAQIFGALLAEYRKNLTNNPSECRGRNSWSRFRLLARQAIESAGLPVKSWGVPHRNKDKWTRWADFISLREDESSVAYELIKEFQDLEKVTNDRLDI